mmetsp:Transcript_38409/g.92923  ORF Transcript_38409/g.92923 Transcript_38409/m.92923 type:complete len:533 (+) Transcript_38409:222-1820(+)
MGSKTATVLRIVATAYIWTGVSSFFLHPHKRALVPSLTRSQEYYCRQQADGQFQCWQLNKLSVQNGRENTRLYDGATETESSSMTPEARKALISRLSNNSQSPTHNNGANTTTINGSNGISATTATANGSNGVSATMDGPPRIQLEDVPQPTVNGGFTHTSASRAKIGAANKGKKPWNKGKARSEEVKARIAAGVRAKNRERFLQKLKDQGITEEEYDAQVAAKKAKKEADKKARRTAKGGYRPTEETKAKISKILKEKHAKGEVKRRTVDPSKTRKGFTHSEETRAKISASLKERWANDPEYREKMKEQSRKSSSSEETRKRISETLKKKWKDPEFRSQMLEKMATASGGTLGQRHNEEHRKKISDAMKARWKDERYREKLMESIANRKAPANRPKREQKKDATKGSVAKREQLMVVKPLRAGEEPAKKKRARKKKIVFAESEDDVIKARQPKPKGKKKVAVKKERKKKEPDGSVNRLREESRDLFDLLYGDEDQFDDVDEASKPIQRKPTFFDFGDEDLDAFDPYGLEDY